MKISAVGTVTWLVLAAMLIGKTLGIFSLGTLANRIGSPLPTGMTAWDLLLMSMIAGIGLTVALLMCTAAFPVPHIRAAAKDGALGSVMITP